VGWAAALTGGRTIISGGSQFDKAATAGSLRIASLLEAPMIFNAGSAVRHYVVGYCKNQDFRYSDFGAKTRGVLRS
jgi:hypothetical protein